MGLRCSWKNIPSFTITYLYHYHHILLYEVDWGYSSSIHYLTDTIYHFILDNIISQFCIPSTLISDNGTSFKNKYVKQFLEKYHIQHQFSTPCYPHSNGQVKSSNWIIKQILPKTINKHRKDWHTQSTYSLWAYRTNICISMSTTPYNFDYGANTIMPLELDIPSLWIYLKGIIDYDSYREQCIQQLEILYEQAINTLDHI